MVKRIILGFLTVVFLVILAPVFAFSLLAPWAVQTILVWWVIFVVVGSAAGGAVSLWVFMESRG